MSGYTITPFKWADFCSEYGLSVRTSGKSTHRGDIYVRCPWCVSGAEKHLMGLSMESTVYGCWKDDGHRGRNPIRLIQALLEVSWSDARDIAQRHAPKGLDFFVRAAPQEDEVRDYQVPSTLKTRFPAAAQEYVESRGIRLEDFKRLGGAFGGTHPDNEFSWRVVLPITMPDGRLVGATGRAVGEGVTPPYMTLPKKLDAGLLGPHWCRESSSILIVVEGPFDAIKLQIASEFYQMPIDVIASLGVASSKSRQVSIREMSRMSYEHVAWIMDRKEYAKSLQYSGRMCMPSSAHMGYAKDPGSLEVEEAKPLLDEVLACAKRSLCP